MQVIAQGATPPPGANPTPQEALAVLNSMNTARLSVDVLGSNIDNLVLTVSSGMSVPGRVRIEGREATAADLQRISISLQSTSGGASILTMLQGGGVRPAEDGTF